MKDLEKENRSISKHDTTPSNRKNAPSVPHGAGFTHLSKSDVRYWRKRVSRRSDGSSYSARLSYAGRRIRFNLHTSSKEAAAAKAKNIYQFLVAVGWDATLAKHKPEIFDKTNASKLGDYIKAVEEHSTQNTKTLAIYIAKTRTVVGEIRGLKKGPDIANPKGKAFKAWRDKIDSTKLTDLNLANVQKWKKRRIDAASDPLEKERARRTVNSILRNAKSLFSCKIRNEISGTMAVSDPVPFSEVQLERVPQKKFKSILKTRGGLPWLIATAKSELTIPLPKVDNKNLQKTKEARAIAQSAHEQFKCLLLGLACGMRRNEIDILRWQDLDYENNLISIEVSEHGSLKTPESEALIGAPPQVMAELRKYMQEGKGEFVIQSNRKPNPNAKYPSYRCQLHFRRLSAWLRSKGIDVAKPLHQLRGECATAIAAESGILAAAQQLRHSSLQTTKTYYSDRLRFSLPDVGEALEQSEMSVVAEEEAS